MHIGLIVDEQRLIAEHTTLNRLCIGLIGEGAQLTRIVPDAIPPHVVDHGEQRVALASTLHAPMNILPWMRTARARELVDALDRKIPDVFYALGPQAWTLGMDLARLTERPLALDIWSARQARRAPRGRGRRAVAGYIASTEPIAQTLRARVGAELVGVVPMGVALPKEPRRILSDPEHIIGLAVIGRCSDVPAYRALLTALADLVDRMPQIRVFMELAGPNEHDIWRCVRKLDLLPHVSSITDAMQHRALLLRCDLLITPERAGTPRSLILEAMAHGLAIIAVSDPHLDSLSHGHNALLIGESTPESWGHCLNSLLNDPEQARILGGKGRTYAAEHFPSSAHVASLLEALNRIVHGGAYEFASPDA
jgi:glycosyltransferase involved in cell wall biosynthesis